MVRAVLNAWGVADHVYFLIGFHCSRCTGLVDVMSLHGSDSWWMIDRELATELPPRVIWVATPWRASE